MLLSLVVIVIVVLAVVFSVQNAAPVTMSFLLWSFQASLAIVVLLSLIGGIVIASTVFSIFRLRSALRKRQDHPAPASDQGKTGPEKKD